MRNIKPYLLVVVGYFLLNLMTGCSERQQAALSGKNLLLVSIDTLRADHLSPYGKDIDTPVIQRLADEGILFERVSAPAPMTQPSHSSLFTGMYVGRHGVRDNFNYVLNDQAVTLAECFQQAGYETAGFVASTVMSTRTGLAQGFETYDDRFSRRDYAIHPMVQRDGEDVRDLALKWLRNRTSQKPFFLFTHFFDPHLPYAPPPDIQEKYGQRLYDGEIVKVDRCLAAIVEELEKSSLSADTLIVVLSDHGESLNEHDEQAHGLFLYESTMHVPLIFRFPDGKGKGMRVINVCSLIDVMPTLLELYGMPAAEGDGVSLVPLLNGQSMPERDIYAETQYPLFFNWSPSYFIRRGDYKYILSPQPELYDISKDRDEIENRVAILPQAVNQLRPLIEEKVKLWAQPASTAETSMSLQTAEAVSALGYTGGAVTQPSDPMKLPDTKNKTQVYRMIDEGLNAMARRRIQTAEETFRKVVDLDPQNPSPYLNLGDVLARVGRFEEAETYLRISLDLSPNNKMTQNLLANVLVSMGRLDEAEALYDALLADTPQLPEALFFKGQIYEKRGDAKKALEFYQQVEKLTPELPGLKESIELVKAAP